LLSELHEVSSGILRVPLDGGTFSILTSGMRWLRGIASDNTSVYWTDGAVKKVPIGGGPVETIANGTDAPIGIAVDDISIYWTSEGGAVTKVTPK
jgi:hypothetical protein